MPGDIMYVPALWSHCTINIGETSYRFISILPMSYLIKCSVHHILLLLSCRGDDRIGRSDCPVSEAKVRIKYRIVYVCVLEIKSVIERVGE
jgi:hypothetical protein